MIYKIHHYNEVKSTNDQLKKLATDNPIEGTVVIADEQTKGKGRMGRNWHSESKSGIYMSILLTPCIPPAKTPQMTLISGIAVCRAIREIAGLHPLIKWPNDILINGRKISGILLETSLHAPQNNKPAIKYIIAGIGVNVCTEYFPEPLKDKASSILLETGKKYSCDEIMQEILMQFEKVYTGYLQNGFKHFIDEYKNICVTLHKTIKAIYKDGEVIGDAIDISNEGELIVRVPNGEIIKINSGEVSIRNVNDDYI